MALACHEFDSECWHLYRNEINLLIEIQIGQIMDCFFFRILSNVFRR
jgi:hypothetical protein